MADGHIGTAINQLRRLIGEESGCTLTDAQLVESFVQRRDEASFEVLVWRHGTMVFNLCQRILHDRHEAEDAFQAVFLVLARKAGSIGKSEAVGSWLYKTAYRIALRMRAKVEKHGVAREAIDDLPAPPATDNLLWRDLRPVLDEEINCLPEKYRAPFVLCYLQDHTNEEAAERLGCPKGTILSRLARGREWLRNRLTRRGLTLSVAGLTAVLAENVAAATAPAALIETTTKAALPFAAGKPVTGLVSATVLKLTEGVLHTMFLTKMKLTATALMALAALVSGAGWLTLEALAQRPAAPAADREAAAQRQPAANPADITGKVVHVAKDGKSITIEAPPAGRGEEPKKAEVKIGDKTTITYAGVGPDGAKPTEGYMVQVHLAEGTKDTAASLSFQGMLRFREPGLVGRVTAVAKDGKGISVEQAARGRGEEGKSIDIKFTDKTLVSFSNIGKDGAKLAAGMFARVWLDEGAKDVAYAINLVGSESNEERGGKDADIVGRVVSASNDGKTVMLAMPPANRGDEPVKTEIKLGEKATVVYHNVGPDAAKLVEGMTARIWLAEGSKDTAAKASVSGVVRERGTMIGGKVASVAKDGKSITLEARPEARGEEPKKIEIKLTDKTKVAYFGVGPDEAKLAEGLFAQVRVEDDAKDTAVQVQFNKAGAERGR